MSQMSQRNQKESDESGESLVVMERQMTNDDESELYD